MRKLFNTFFNKEYRLNGVYVSIKSSQVLLHLFVIVLAYAAVFLFVGEGFLECFREVFSGLIEGFDIIGLIILLEIINMMLMIVAVFVFYIIVIVVIAIFFNLPAIIVLVAIVFLFA